MHLKARIVSFAVAGTLAFGALFGLAGLSGSGTDTLSTVPVMGSLVEVVDDNFSADAGGRHHKKNRDRDCGCKDGGQSNDQEIDNSVDQSVDQDIDQSNTSYTVGSGGSQGNSAAQSGSNSSKNDSTNVNVGVNATLD